MSPWLWIPAGLAALYVLVIVAGYRHRSARLASRRNPPRGPR